MITMTVEKEMVLLRKQYELGNYLNQLVNQEIIKVFNLLIVMMNFVFYTKN